LRVYHGTSKDQDFSTFKIGNRGAWFTTDPADASGYANENDAQTSKLDYGTGKYVPVNQAPRVIPAYLNLKNPYKMTAVDLAMHQRAENYGRHQGQHFTKLRAQGYDGVDFGNGTYVAFHPHQIKGIFNERPTSAKALNKTEEDEVDRLLMHSNPVERRLALKLGSVSSKHLIRALQDPDPEIQRQALRHHGVDANVLTALMQMPNHEHLQLLALKHPHVQRGHLEALYHNHKTNPGSDDVIRAISWNPHLDAGLIEQMVEDGHGHGVVENLNTPTHVLERLIEAHAADPTDPDKKALARRAVQHPSAPKHLVEAAFRDGPLDVKLAVARGPHLPAAMAQDVLMRGLLPGNDHEALLRHAIVQHEQATPQHLQTAAKDRNAFVRAHAQRRLGVFKHARAVGDWLSKATRPDEFKAVLKQTDTGAGAALVDHKPDLEAHPAHHQPDVQAYRAHVLDNPSPVRRSGTGASTGGSGIMRKVVYKIPDHHPTHPGERFMVKPYHTKPIQRIAKWGKLPINGWAEMTNQALYHAGGIGDLHQRVHVSEHNMGPGHEQEPALVVRMDQHAKGMDSWSATPETEHGARKIALMDFLSNNLDRHYGNLMQHRLTNAPIAIDHDRSFQYQNVYKWKGSPVRSQPREMEDNLGDYVHRSALNELVPLAGNRSQWDLHPDKRKSHYDQQLQDLDDWRPAFEWWDEAGPQVRRTMYERLNQIKDPEVRAHIRRNFDARANYLDDRARHGIENFGIDWPRDSVRLYRPGEKDED
jgi:hypothetical protein